MSCSVTVCQPERIVLYKTFLYGELKMNRLFIVLVVLILVLSGCGGGGGGGDDSTLDQAGDPGDTFTSASSYGIFATGENIPTEIGSYEYSSIFVEGSKILGYDSNGLYTATLSLLRAYDLSELDFVDYNYVESPYNYDNTRTVHAITQSNDYAYDFDGYDLMVYDLSGALLELVYKVSDIGPLNRATESLVYNGFLYIFGNERVDVFSLTDPAHPEIQRSLNVNLSFHQTDHISGFSNGHYVVINGENVAVYSLNNGDPSLAWSGTVAGLVYYGNHQFAIANNQIFAVSNGYIDLYQIASDGRLVLMKTLDIEMSGTSGLLTMGNMLYVRRGGAELLPSSDIAIYDVSTVGTPTLLGAAEDVRIDSKWPIITDTNIFFRNRDGGAIKFTISGTLPPGPTPPLSQDNGAEPLSLDDISIYVLSAGYTFYGATIIHEDGGDDDADLVDIGNIGLFRLNGGYFENDLGFAYDHSGMRPADAVSILYLDTDMDSSTGFSVNGIGADWRLADTGSNNPQDYGTSYWDGSSWALGSREGSSDATYSVEGGYHFIAGIHGSENFLTTSQARGVLSLEKISSSGEMIELYDRTRSFMIPVIQ